MPATSTGIQGLDTDIDKLLGEGGSEALAAVKRALDQNQPIEELNKIDDGSILRLVASLGIDEVYERVKRQVRPEALQILEDARNMIIRVGLGNLDTNQTIQQYMLGILRERQQRERQQYEPAVSHIVNLEGSAYWEGTVPQLEPKMRLFVRAENGRVLLDTVLEDWSDIAFLGSSILGMLRVHMERSMPLHENGLLELKELDALARRIKDADGSVQAIKKLYAEYAGRQDRGSGQDPK